MDLVVRYTKRLNRDFAERGDVDGATALIEAMVAEGVTPTLVSAPPASGLGSLGLSGQGQTIRCARRGEAARCVTNAAALFSVLSACCPRVPPATPGDDEHPDQVLPQRAAA
jgi:hypothetical protein